MTPINLVTTILVMSWIIPLLAFIIFYAQSPWNKSDLGITLMLQKVSFLAVMVLSVLGLWLGEYVGRDWIRLAVFICVTALFWADVINLRKYQRHKQDAQDREDAALP